MSETTLSTKSQERMYPVQGEREVWSPGMNYAPVWSRTMAAPMSRSEATLSFTQKPQMHGPAASVGQIHIQPPRSSDDQFVGVTISASPNPPTSLQQTVWPTELQKTGPIGGTSPVLPRPPTTQQPTQRPSEPAGAGPAVRLEAVRQKKLAVMEKSDSVDEDEFDKLVAINYKQLVNAPPIPTGTATLSPPVTTDPRRSPKMSPQLVRRPSPVEHTTPISAGAPHQQPQQTAAGISQDLKTQEESEDELSK